MSELSLEDHLDVGKERFGCGSLDRAQNLSAIEGGRRYADDPDARTSPSCRTWETSLRGALDDAGLVARPRSKLVGG